MESVKSLLSCLNKKVIIKRTKRKIKTMVCTNATENIPHLLSSKCLQEIVVYKATITSKYEIKEYIGSTGGLVKKRWYAHISDIIKESS